MSRLIDADKLIEILEENNQKLQEQIRDAREYLQKEVYEAQYFTVVDIVKLINEQPTIFDVEQLEEFKEYKKNKHRSLRYMYEKGYNKGIDETCNYICCEWSLDRINTCEDFDKISQQLRGEVE